MSQYVLVTGAGSGIGKCIAKKYAAEGYSVVAVDWNAEALQSVKEGIERSSRVTVLPVTANLMDDYAPEKILQQCRDAGAEVEILINCAGMGAAGEFAESDWNRQKGIVELNVVALMHMIRVFLPEMLERGHGQICNIASNAGFMPLAPQPTYGASKAFVISFTQALYETYHKKGIDFTVICPGPTKTAFFKDAGFDLKNLKGATPESVADFTYDNVRRKKAMASHGFMTKVESVGSRLFPRAWVRKVAAIMAEN